MIQPTQATKTSIEGLWKLDLKVIPDERGSVIEFYRHSEFEALGLPTLGERPQVNAPFSVRGAVRGIHAEYAHKYVAVANGTVFAAIVDLRQDSLTFGEHESFTLNKGQGLFVSKGLGNSFQSISTEPSTYLYYFENEWQPNMPGIACNPLDPDLAIDWPIKENEGMILSEKDRSNPSIADIQNSYSAAQASKDASYDEK